MLISELNQALLFTDLIMTSRLDLPLAGRGSNYSTIIPGEDSCGGGPTSGGPVKGGSTAPSWARGNPYAIPFPRGRTWTRHGNVQGLSGTRPPSEWNEEAEQLEATLAEKQKRVSAKDMYYRLVNASALEREKRAAPKSSPPTKSPPSGTTRSSSVDSIL